MGEIKFVILTVGDARPKKEKNQKATNDQAEGGFDCPSLWVLSACCVCVFFLFLGVRVDRAKDRICLVGYAGFDRVTCRPAAAAAIFLHVVFTCPSDRFQCSPSSIDRSIDCPYPQDGVDRQSTAQRMTVATRRFLCSNTHHSLLPCNHVQQAQPSPADRPREAMAPGAGGSLQWLNSLLRDGKGGEEAAAAAAAAVPLAITGLVLGGK